MRSAERTLSSAMNTGRLVVDVVELQELAALLEELTERRSCRSALRHSTIVFSHRPANGASPDLSEITGATEALPDLPQMANLHDVDWRRVARR